jgi:hypothetical protein
MEERGVDRQTLTNEMRTTPAFRHAAFQELAWKAMKYDELLKAPKAEAMRNLPPVVRPGAAGASRGNDNSSKIAALNAALDGAATETAQLNIARQILKLRGAA